MQTLTELEMLESTYMFYTVRHHTIYPYPQTLFILECTDRVACRRRIMGTTSENTG